MPVFREVLLYLGAAVVAVPVASRLGLGSVLGYLAAGLLIGPHALRLTGGDEGVATASELGVVLLLFLVGLELEPQRLLKLRRVVFGLGTAQVIGTTAVLALGALALGLPWREAVVVGMALTLSSTSLVLPLLSERRELGTPHGQAAFGISLLQDLAVIPVLALLPALGGTAQARPLWLTALLAGAAVAGVALGSRLLARPALRWVGALRDPEVFTATALLLVIGTAWAVSATGLSMALGAFLAGVLLAGSEYRHELEADIAPFKGLLLGLFFVSVGARADLSLLWHRPVAVLGTVAGFVALKAAVGAIVGWRGLRDGDGALSLGLLLSQGSEFAFVMLAMAAGQGLVRPELEALLVLAVTLSMATTPALFALHARLVRPRLARRDRRPYDVAPEGDPPVIVAGFGRVGQVVGRVLRAKRIPFTAMDASPEHIEFIRRFGNKVFYGDASRLDLLRAARADRARIFVLAIDDVEASIRTAEVVLQHFPHLTLFARARNRQHAYRLRALGVTRIMRETWLSSLALTGEVLEALGADAGEARTAVERFRAHDEALFEESWQDQGDLDKLAERSSRSRAQLEQLFDEDARTRRPA
ncbi:MAG: monovalent cation:proton antiporter-2 (CPA2) family protein [Anaeromyxobacter sp.]